MLTELEKSILRVLAFFDMSGYPVTILELQKWTGGGIAIHEQVDVLTDLCQKNIISHKGGHYFLFGRDDLVDLRLESYRAADQKFKKALRVINILKYFPWVRAIAIYGSLSLSNCGRDSDIDLFIITAQKRLWASRFFINTFLKIFKLRPKADKSKDKFCVSYLISDGQMNLQSVVSPENEMFYSHSIGQFVFIYEQNQEMEKFFAANSWLRNKFYSWFPYRMNSRRQVVGGYKFIKSTAEKIFGLISERSYERIQRHIMPENLKTVDGPSDVIINDQMLKLHSSNRSRDWESRYNIKIDNLFNVEN